MKIQINKQLILEGFENHISDIDNMTMDNFRKMDPQQQTLENLQSTQLIAGGSKDKILGMGLDNNFDQDKKIAQLLSRSIDNNTSNINNLNSTVDTNHNIALSGLGLGALGAGLGGAALYRTRNQNQVR